MARPKGTVLLTHSEGRLEGLAAALSARGFSVTHHPLIRTEFLPPEAVRPSAEALLACDWLLFTSRTAVRAWAALGLPLGRGPNIGAVGTGTAAEVARSGGCVTLNAQPESAQGLLETFVARVAPPARVGLPCGEAALPTLATGLAEAGFAVTQTHLYRTTPRPLPDITADLIVLASPSAVAALPDVLSAKTQLIALGPSTHEAVQKRGWRATQAEAPTLEGVVGAVLAAAPLETRQETP